MNIDYGNVQSDTTVESCDDLQQIPHILRCRMSLGPWGTDWPIYGRGLLRIDKGSPVPVLPRLAR